MGNSSQQLGIAFGGAVEVVVDSRLTVVRPSVHFADLLRGEFTYKNPDVSKSKRLGLWTHPAEKVHNYAEHADGSVSVPRGGARKLAQLAEEEHVELSWTDQRQEAPCAAMPTYEEAAALLANEGIFPTARQVEIADNLIERENAYVRAVTGVGKSVLLGIAIVKAGQRALYLVPTGGLRDQALGDFADMVGARAVGKLGGSPHALRPIMITTFQGLRSIQVADNEWSAEVRRSFGTVVSDELHLAGAATFIQAVEWMPARYRWGASSDERRTDRKEFMIYDAFGRMADAITLDEALADDRIVNAGITVVPTGFTDPEYEEVVLGKAFIPARFRRELAQLLLDKIEADPARNALIARRMAVEHAAGHCCIVMARHIAHCEAIIKALEAEGVEAALLRGGPENRAAFRAGVQAMRDGRLRAAVGSPATFTGLNVPQLDRGFVAVPQAGNMRLLDQMIGRFRRKFVGKTEARVFYFWDPTVHPGHAKKIEHHYRRFRGLVTVEPLTTNGGTDERRARG